MIECKFRDVKAIYEQYEKYSNEDCKALIGTQPSILQYGYYVPSQANWSYKLGYVKVGNTVYNVVTVFGQVKAAIIANLPEYNTNLLNKE